MSNLISKYIMLYSQINTSTVCMYISILCVTLFNLPNPTLFSTSPGLAYCPYPIYLLACLDYQLPFQFYKSGFLNPERGLDGCCPAWAEGTAMLECTDVPGWDVGCISRW